MDKESKQISLQRGYSNGHKYIKRCSILSAIREIQTKNSMRYTFITIRMSIVKNTCHKTRAAEVTAKLEPLLYYWQCKMKWLLIKQFEIPQNVKYKVSTLPHRFIPRYICKRNENDIYIKSCMWNVHNTVVLNSQMWKQFKYLSDDEQKNKMWYIHIMGCCYC